MSHYLFTFSLAVLLSACSSSKCANTHNDATETTAILSDEQVIITDEGPFQISYFQASDDYTIRRADINREVADLRFVKRYFHYYQVLDKNNEIFYLDDSLNVLNEVQDFMFTCGTVPHYSMTIVTKGNDFVVFSDETFFDMNGEEPAVEVARISMDDADELMFINGQSAFNYDANFAVGQEVKLDPKMLIGRKGGKFFMYGAPEVLYDEVFFTQFWPSLITRNGVLFGLYNIIEPTFTEIGEFTYFLAPVTLPSGKKAFLDVFGKVYK